MKKWSLLLLLICSPLVSYGALTDNLKGYWPLDETSGARYDSTINDLDLTDNNTVLYETGKISNSAKFVGTNSEYLSSTDTDFERGADPWSFCFWYKPVSVSAGEEDIISKYTSGTDRQYILYQNNTDVAITTYLGSNASYTYSSALSAETWKFICGGYDDSVLKVWLSIDGGVKGYSSALTGTATEGTTAPLHIGRSNESGYPNYITADIDELGYWQKVISADEITELYNGGDGLTYPFTGETGTSTATTTTSTDLSGLYPYLGSIILGIGIVVGLMSLGLVGYIFNRLSSKKPWQH